MSDSHNPSLEALQECPDDHLLQLYLQDALDEEHRSQIDVHVEACPLCAELLVTLAELLVPEHSLPTPSPHQWIGRYQLIRVLGKGGMGAVYEGYDPQLQRSVALKVIRRDAWGHDAEDVLKQRMIREARALARLIHPHVLPIYESDEWEGELYIAMQLVQGEDMRHWLVRHQPTWSDIITIFLQAAKGLHAAHQAGIIHRDIKPDNLLITAEGHLYLADFGLVSQDPAQGGLSSRPLLQSVAGDRLTMTGAVVGTHGYLAPELYRGQPADARSDQFAFCVALYEALYQQMPHTALPLADHLKDLEAGAIKTPLVDDVPSEFFGVLQRGMDPIPSRRFGSMELLQQELHRILTQQETSPTRPERPAYVPPTASEAIDTPAAPARAPRSFPLVVQLLLAMLFAVVGAASVLLLARGGERRPLAPSKAIDPTTSQAPRQAQPLQRRGPTDAVRARPTAPAHKRASPRPRPRVRARPKAPLGRRSQPRRAIRVRRRAAAPPAPRRPRRPLAARRSKRRRFRSRRVALAPRAVRRSRVRRLRRRQRRRSRTKANAAGRIYWWIKRLPHHHASRCEELERQYRGLAAQGQAALRQRSSQRIWRGYASCQIKAGLCRQGMRNYIQLKAAHSRRGASELHKQRAFQLLVDRCPARPFLHVISRDLISYFKTIGPRHVKHTMWCRRLISRIIRKHKRYAPQITRSPTARRRFRAMIWEGTRCTYQRAIGLASRAAKHSTCRRMLRDLNRFRSALRERGISTQRFLRRFPECRIH